MAELDIKALKHQATDFGGQPLGVDRAVYLPVAQWWSIIAVLEDHEQLRAENERLREMAYHVRNAFRVLYSKEAAALEGHDD